MLKNNFIEIERIVENAIEDNVMYKIKQYDAIHNIRYCFLKGTFKMSDG